MGSQARQKAAFAASLRVTQFPTGKCDLTQAASSPCHMLPFFTLNFLLPDNPSQVGSVSVTVKVLDVNDNAPEFARFYETFVCENAKAGQVRNACNTRGWEEHAVLHGGSMPGKVSVGKRAQLLTHFI